MRIVRFSLPLLSWALLAGCAEGWGLGGQEGEDLVVDDTGTAGDTDASTDTDVDADTSDTGTDTDGGPRHYVGLFEIDATDAAGLADRCTGTVAIRVDDDTATGAGACTFSGALAPAFPEGLGAAVLGTIAGDETASGTVHVTSGATGDLPWTGARTTNLAGTFTGTLSTSATRLTVTGRFDAAPE